MCRTSATKGGHDAPAIILFHRYDGRISRILEQEHEHEQEYQRAGQAALESVSDTRNQAFSDSRFLARTFSTSPNGRQLTISSRDNQPFRAI
jgi:hypothetical protein